MKNRMKTDANINARKAYVVLTYVLAFTISFFARASASLLRMPWPMPTSKRLNQLKIALMVIQMPYLVGSR